MISCDPESRSSFSALYIASDDIGLLLTSIDDDDDNDDDDNDDNNDNVDGDNNGLY